MITFFRNIRRSLMSENRFSKYLFYALGEIVLVVIGILIALQINNWNEGRKAGHVELKYIQQLRKDLQADSVFFASRLEGLESQVESLKKLKKMCQGSLDAAERNQVLGFRDNPFTSFAMQSKVVHDDLDLTAVSDDGIRELLRQYRSKYEYVQVSGSTCNTMAQENFATMAKRNPILLEKDPTQYKLEHYSSFCEFPNIEGIIGLQILHIRGFLAQTEKFMELNETLSTEIKAYIRAH